MQSFHFPPVLVLVKSESSHTMSAVLVVEDVESGPSDVVPVHFEAQGELGVTDRAESGRETVKRSNKDKEWTAMSNGLDEKWIRER